MHNWWLLERAPIELIAGFDSCKHQRVCELPYVACICHLCFHYSSLSALDSVSIQSIMFIQTNSELAIARHWPCMALIVFQQVSFGTKLHRG